MNHKNLLANSLKQQAIVAEEVTSVELEEDSTQEYFDSLAEVAQQEMAIEDAEGAEAGLESALIAAQAAAEAGEITATTAAFLQIAADNAMAPFGGAGIVQLPGKESFEEDGGREAALAAGIESLQENMAKVWDTIVKFIKGIGASIAKFYQQHLALVGRVNKKATALVSSAKKLKGTPKEKELKIGGGAQALAIDGKVDDIAKVLSQLSGVVGNAIDSDKLTDAATKYAKAIAAAVTDESKAGDAVKASEDFFSGVAKAYDLTEEVKGDDRFGDNTVVRSKATLPGDKAVFLVTTPAEDEKAATLVSFGVMATSDDVKKVEKDFTMKALDAKEIGEIAASVKEVTKTILAAKADDKAADAMRKELIKIGDDLQKGAEKEGFGTKVSLKWALMRFRSLATKMHKPKMDVMNAATSSLNAALNVAIKASKNFDGKEAKKEDDKKEGEE